jgi:hypothetical protein
MNAQPKLMLVVNPKPPEREAWDDLLRYPLRSVDDPAFRLPRSGEEVWAELMAKRQARAEAEGGR